MRGQSSLMELKTEQRGQLRQVGFGLEDVLHVERELRFYRPDNFKAPKYLANLKLRYSFLEPHLDTYYDTSLQGSLRAQKVSLRVRQKEDGFIVTLKENPGRDKGMMALRHEWEEKISSKKDLKKSAIYKHALFLASRYSGEKEKLKPLYSVKNKRLTHLYSQGQKELLLSEDKITYPNQSKEKRVEVEISNGPSYLLDNAEEDMKNKYKIESVKSGKRSEARRRLK